MSNSEVNFSGSIHDHAAPDSEPSPNSESSLCPTIAIMKRHPMYDSLVLVKKYRLCLSGYALEFPLVYHDHQDLSGQQQKVDETSINTNKMSYNNNHKNNNNNCKCVQRKLISRYLDGDDPWMIKPETNNQNQPTLDNMQLNSMHYLSSSPSPLAHSTFLNKYPPQIDDLGEVCELVHVPINGLLDRLKQYTESGVAVDSKVYAFAMGLKTAERILTLSSMREINETPYN